jgi:hypothetical protein
MGDEIFHDGSLSMSHMVYLGFLEIFRDWNNMDKIVSSFLSLYHFSQMIGVVETVLASRFVRTDMDFHRSLLVQRNLSLWHRKWHYLLLRTIWFITEPLLAIWCKLELIYHWYGPIHARYFPFARPDDTNLERYAMYLTFEVISSFWVPVWKNHQKIIMFCRYFPRKWGLDHCSLSVIDRSSLLQDTSACLPFRHGHRRDRFISSLNSFHFPSMPLSCSPLLHWLHRSSVLQSLKCIPSRRILDSPNCHLTASRTFLDRFQHPFWHDPLLFHSIHFCS